ncbi:MAG: TolC family protein [Bacteroidales bacterium]|nr:TolC family protein [Bacteroidales bacterium]
MNSITRGLIVGSLFGMTIQSSYSQNLNTIQLSLKNVVDLAITQSSSVKYVQNTNVNYYWRWQNFQTTFRPQLTLRGDLPNYTHSTTPVTQPDGSIQFKQVSNAQTSANVSLSQSIPVTGTSVYATTSVYRIQDFNNKTVEFSGSPFLIGFVQPVFAYNWMKWSRMTEPLLYDQAQKLFVESIEQISLYATDRFFRYLRVQTQFNLATTNLKNSRDNLKIAETRRELGTISENDFSRIQLSVLNAQKALNKAEMDLKNADFNLKSYIGLEQEQEFELIPPLNMTLFDIDPRKALEEARNNRKETPDFERRLIEADAQLTQAKRNTGLHATITGSYGMSNNDEYFAGIYEQVEKERQLRLSLSIPILDWGRSESQVKLAQSLHDLVVYDVEKDKERFERGVIVQVEQFGLLRDQIKTAGAADKVAENGYLIALKKFQNGEISITDLNISLQEREAAKNDYISSLEAYWVAFYNLRILTLYDFEMQQKIDYVNPMLSGEQ